MTTGTATATIEGLPIGLSEDEARSRLASEGGNAVPGEGGHSWWDIVRRNLFTFINITLMAVGIILIVMGRPRDALLASGLAVINGLVGVVQEARAKRRLDQIALLNRTMAVVVRDGKEQQIAPEEIVRGDVLRLGAGDQVFADGTVVGDSKTEMEMDESLLTGESDPVPKRPGDAVSSGSFCISGSGWYQADRVGAANTAAQMTAGARAYRVPLTPLQTQVNIIVRLLLVMAAFFLVTIILGSVIWEYPVEDTILAAAVVLGIVPSGLFLMIVVTYSMGAVRLASQDALVQGTNAVESLSNVNIFCMDKTGTLTANKMRLAEVQPIGDVSDEQVRAMLGAFARSTSAGTKTSEAVAEAVPGERQPVTGEVPFSSAYKWSGVSADVDGFRGIFVMGAPEFLGPQLATKAPLTPPEGWADKGIRTLLFAHAPRPGPFEQKEGLPALPPGVEPVAWLGLTDELRPHVDQALQGFRDAGITLKVISGDNPETVAALARQAGLSGEARLISGIELDAMDDIQFREAAEQATVFGRVTPAQKQRLVEALRGAGHYVAMTGDGVNDVLSLKQANLGIAMQSGSQATRSAADIVLLHDSFGALPKAFREGQRIRRGLCRILELFLSRVFAVALLILAVLIVQAGFPLSPAQISLLTLLTVGIPTFGIALWTPPGIPPRNLPLRLLQFVLPAASLLALASFGVYLGVYLLNDIDLPSLRAGGVAAATSLPATDHLSREAATHVLVLGGLILVLFAAPPGPWFAVVEDMDGERRPAYLALAMVPLYALIMFVPTLRNFFELRGLTGTEYGIVVMVVLVWMYILRWVWAEDLFGRFFGYTDKGVR